MSTIPPGKPPLVTPQDDIYVTLLVTSAVVLLFGIIFVAVRSFQLFGSVWPPGGA